MYSELLYESSVVNSELIRLHTQRLMATNEEDQSLPAFTPLHLATSAAFQDFQETVQTPKYHSVGIVTAIFVVCV